jgi:hypothetical protein
VVAKMKALAEKPVNRDDVVRLVPPLSINGRADTYVSQHALRAVVASVAPDTATPGEAWVDTPDDFEGYDTATHAEARLDIECGAKHPTRPSAVPCQRLAGHEGSHLSTTGCAGSAMHWPASSADKAERHHHSRKAMECTHVANDCCVDCCEPGGVFETPASSSADDKAGE